MIFAELGFIQAAMHHLLQRGLRIEEQHADNFPPALHRNADRFADVVPVQAVDPAEPVVGVRRPTRVRLASP